MALRSYGIYLIAICCLMTSCEELFLEEELATNQPQQNLDYLWTECDRKYAFFELKDVDWDQVYADHSAMIYDGMTDDSLFNVLGSMLRQLRDDHTNLISPFNISFFGVSRLGPDNYDARIISDHYLPDNYYVSGPFRHDFVAGTNKEVGYIRFASFTGIINEINLGFVLDRYKDTKGLILDLRENGGGAVTDVFGLLSRFVNEKTLLFYSRLKDGPGHNDFTEPEPAYVEPADGVKYMKKVMVLIDRGTFSAGSYTALGAKAIPNMILIGDSTGGGLGLPNGGQLPNGWTYRFSITQTLDLNLNNEYEDGVPPDIYAYLDRTNLEKDEVIERALDEILDR